MPPIPAPPVITAGSALIGQTINALSQQKINRDQLNYNRQAYAQQRQDSLADWTMQNQYNSPEAQMARLKMAGLNPNLVYGQGVTQQAANVKPAEMKAWNPSAPQFDLGAVSGQYFDTKMQQQTVNNLEALNTKIVQETALKALQAANIGVKTAHDKFSLEQAQKLATGSLTIQQLNVDKLRQDLELTKGRYGMDTQRLGMEQGKYMLNIKKNEMDLAVGSQSLKESAQRIISARIRDAISLRKAPHEIDNLKETQRNINTDTRIKEADLKLKEAGVQPSDEIYWRVLQNVLSGSTFDISKMIKGWLEGAN